MTNEQQIKIMGALDPEITARWEKIDRDREYDQKHLGIFDAIFHQM